MKLPVALVPALALLATALPAAAQTAPAAPASASPSPTPDYRQDASWLCRPGRNDACTANQDATVDRGRRQPHDREVQAAIPRPKFDCFYVYPTVSLDPTPNSDMNVGPEENTRRRVPGGAFHQNCRVFAPMYRQVTLTALQATACTGKPVTADREMAYHDVKAAWDDYLKRDNHGRGVVLIGHSQGSRASSRQLLAGAIEGTPAREAADLGDDPGDQSRGAGRRRWSAATSSARRCASPPTSIGCVVTYVTFRADSPPPANSRFGTGAAARHGRGVRQSGRPRRRQGGDRRDPRHARCRRWPARRWGRGRSDDAPVTTPFVKAPGLISAECVPRPERFIYLAVTVNADPADPRTDTIVGDVVVGGVTLKDWGLHLIDMPVEMGNLVELADHQAAAWRGAPHPKPRSEPPAPTDARTSAAVFASQVKRSAPASHRRGAGGDRRAGRGSRRQRPAARARTMPPIGGLGHDLPRAADVGDDDRRAAGQRLDPGIGEPFRWPRRAPSHRRRRAGAGSSSCGIATEQADAVAKAERRDLRLERGAFGPFAGDEQRGAGDRGDGVDDDVVPLARDQRAERDDQRAGDPQRRLAPLRGRAGVKRARSTPV